jgi:hypothetical protein
LRLTSITINPPKIFLFNTREEAQDFFEEYMNDVDCIDNRCKNGEEVQHKDYCTCGIIEMDDDDNPILFYNKKNQIFLLEQGAQVFQPPQELKNDAKNMNLTNNIMRKCKKLSREQRKRYIELGKYCEDCNSKDDEVGNEGGNEVVNEDSGSEKEKEEVKEDKKEKEQVKEDKKEKVKEDKKEEVKDKKEEVKDKKEVKEEDKKEEKVKKVKKVKKEKVNN